MTILVLSLDISTFRWDSTWGGNVPFANLHLRSCLVCSVQLTFSSLSGCKWEDATFVSTLWSALIWEQVTTSLKIYLFSSTLCYDLRDFHFQTCHSLQSQPIDGKFWGEACQFWKGRDVISEKCSLFSLCIFPFLKNSFLYMLSNSPHASSCAR